jgi:hypothetical protein
MTSASSLVVSLQYTTVHDSTVQCTTAPMEALLPYILVPAVPLAKDGCTLARL